MNAQPRLLVVDDEEPLCRSAVRIFKPRGYSVDTSTSPVEGLRRATSEDYSAILLDMRMPEMDGLTFLRCLRESGNEVPVIVVTGYASVDDASAFMRMGAVDYLPKPFTPVEVSEAVSRVVQQAAEAEVAPTVAEGERQWLGESWVQVADDGSAVVGAILENAPNIDKVALPEPGDEVRQGLPFALITLSDGTTRAVRSPVSGVIAQVRTRADRGEWLLRVRSWDLAKDLDILADERVVEEEQAPVAPAASPRITDVVHRMVVRNRRGEHVAILSTGDLLRRSEGLGAALLAEAERRHMPLRVNLGTWDRDALEVLDDAGRFDRTVLLEPATMGRYAGMLVRTRTVAELLQATAVDSSRVRAYAVQSMERGKGLSLDTRTAAELARILMDELS